MIGDKYSKPHGLTVSVPQGSCAGASIFNLYCSTLHEIIPKDLTLSGFADDHSVRRAFMADSSMDEAENKQKPLRTVCLTLSLGWTPCALR